MSKKMSLPIPAWLRRRGYSRRTKLAVAGACERTARRRADAAESESRCQIIAFPARPLAMARLALAEAAQAGTSLALEA
jgi:hypothetical protein